MTQASNRWLLFSYSVPKHPSTVRVALWRRLRDIGVLYIAQSACLLPDSAQGKNALEECLRTASEAGGTARLVPVEVSEEAVNQALIADFQALRAAEYRELLERAEAMIGELSKESEGGKFTFAELEENEDELEKLEKWLNRISARDVHGASNEAAAGIALQRCRDALALFRDETVDRETDFGSGSIHQASR